MMHQELTVEAAAWLEAHHNPAWKFKPPTVPKPAKLRVLHGREFQDDVQRYKYAVLNTTDRRQVFDAPDLDTWMSKKRAALPPYKPWQLPKPRFTLTKLSSAERTAETARVANYLARRRAAGAPR